MKSMMLSPVSTSECTASESIAELPVMMAAVAFMVAIATFDARAARTAVFDSAICRLDAGKRRRIVALMSSAVVRGLIVHFDMLDAESRSRVKQHDGRSKMTRDQSAQAIQHASGYAECPTRFRHLSQ